METEAEQWWEEGEEGEELTLRNAQPTCDGDPTWDAAWFTLHTSRVHISSGSFCLYIGAYGSLCLVSFDLPLVLGGHDFTDENAHTDSDGSLLPKGTPALVALDIAHI